MTVFRPPLYHTDSCKVLGMSRSGYASQDRELLVPLHLDWRRVVGVVEVPDRDKYHVMPRSTVKLSDWDVTVHPEHGANGAQLSPIALVLDTGATVYAWGEGSALVYATTIGAVEQTTSAPGGSDE